ncbi:MAG: ABC transporter permease [Halanaeroarchaeum sp.]
MNVDGRDRRDSGANALGRVGAEATTAFRTFTRRRTAVFFTFFFPVLLIVIFAGLIQTQPSGGGLFSKPTGYYVPGYLAVVVLFTPLSRISSEVSRYRDDNRFEKLASTPLTRFEWLAAQTLVNMALIVVASLLLLLALLALGTEMTVSLWVVPFVVAGSVLFCGVGALIGHVATSQDGAISMANGIAIPLLFLSETFVTPELFPAWFRSVPRLSPLTYFAQGVRSAVYGADPSTVAGTLGVTGNLAVLSVLAVVFFVAGGRSLRWTGD